MRLAGAAKQTGHKNKGTMTEAICITIPGDPVPKGRPRARIVKSHGREPWISFYTPKETEVYEDAIRWTANSVMQGKPAKECPLEVTVKAFIGVPASWSGVKTQKALHGDIRPISRPDADNFLKIACDALNGFVWRDDSLVWKMQVEKHYSANPRMEIVITETPPPILTT